MRALVVRSNPTCKVVAQRATRSSPAPRRHETRTPFEPEESYTRKRERERTRERGSRRGREGEREREWRDFRAHVRPPVNFFIVFQRNLRSHPAAYMCTR